MRGRHNDGWCRQLCEGSGGGATALFSRGSAVAPRPQLLEQLQHKQTLCERNRILLPFR